MSRSKTDEYYQSVKNEKHVFIRAVCGRSSSTALQRLLNSSNEICIFGEPWGSVDALLRAVDALERHGEKHREISRRDYGLLVDSFEAGSHNAFYPHAFRSYDDTIPVLKELLADLLRPVNGASRFGFKDIGLHGIDVVRALGRVFPASQLVFLFRDPRSQWASVARTGWFPYSKSLPHFLEVYENIGRQYIEYARELEMPCFVESSDLYRAERVRALMRFLSLRGIDESLIGPSVSGSAARSGRAPGLSSQGEFAVGTEVRVIEDSAAFRSYLAMQELAEGFRTRLEQRK